MEEEIRAGLERNLDGHLQESKQALREKVSRLDGGLSDAQRMGASGATKPCPCCRTPFSMASPMASSKADMI